MNAISDYRTIRTSAGTYEIEAPLVRLTGDDRLAHLDRFCSRSAEFVDPDTTRECLALNEDGSPFAILLHVETDEETWLVPRTPVGVEELSDYLSGIEPDGDVTVEINPAGWGAVAVEGPAAWKVAATLVDFDIAGLVLHSVAEVVVPGAEDSSCAWIARVGTTGEYGYLVLSNSPDLATLTVLGRTEEIGGSRVERDGLARVQAEAGMAYYAWGFGDLDVCEADLSWMVDWERCGEFQGSDALPTPQKEQRKITPAVAAADAVVEMGDQVFAGETPIGEILWATPAANPDEQLVIAVVEAPYWVPGLELTGRHTDGSEIALTTVSLPRVLARSAVEKMG